MWNRANLFPDDRTWVLVPIISIGGAILGLFTDTTPIMPLGVWGCVIGSFLLGYLALRKPKKDLVALLTPVYAILIFMDEGIRALTFLPILYGISLTILVFRLNARFSTPDPPRSLRRESVLEEEEEDEDVFE